MLYTTIMIAPNCTTRVICILFLLIFGGLWALDETVLKDDGGHALRYVLVARDAHEWKACPYTCGSDWAELSWDGAGMGCCG